MLEWSLGAFRGATSVAAGVVAAPPSHLGEFAALARGASAGGGLDFDVVEGGESRSESVAAALGGVRTELAVVHDAARPLVTPELIDAVVGALAADPDCDAVLAATPVTDTVKQASTGSSGQPEVERTLDRSALWAAQTPQAFRADALRRALDSGDLDAATDDAMLVERLGGKVLLYEAGPENLKVTTELDLRVAELLLAPGPR